MYKWLRLMTAAASLVGQTPPTLSEKPANGNPLTRPTGRRITISQSNGGSVVTTLSQNIAVNQNSSLMRKRFTLNDSTCPVQLNETGVFTAYTAERFSGSYSFQPVGLAVTQANIRAVGITFVLLDVWGERMRNLGFQRVLDVAGGQEISFHNASWHATESEVGTVYTTLAFVDRVMLHDGTIWRSDRTEITQRLAEVQIAVSESGLERDPQNK